MPEYFELRGINKETYQNHRVQPWLLSELLESGLDARILDFGCGFGQNIRELRGLGFDNVEGCDINRRVVAECVGSGLNVFHFEDLTVFSEAKLSSYDIIFTTHVLEHIPKDQVVFVLSKLKKMLKVGGRIIVSVPNAQAYTGAYWRYEDFTHHLLFTAGSLRYVLLDAGFSDPLVLDPSGSVGSPFAKRVIKLILRKIYSLNAAFWKKALGSPTHLSSPCIYTWEIKMRAIRKE